MQNRIDVTRIAAWSCFASSVVFIFALAIP